MSSGSKECWYKEDEVVGNLTDKAFKPLYEDGSVSHQAEKMLHSQYKEVLDDLLKNGAIATQLTPQYTPYKSQVGGEHYQKAIQPMLFISSNNFNFSVGNVIKYVCRHEKKNGKQDLIKAIHYAMFEAYHKYPDEYDEFIKLVNNLNGKEAPEEE